MLKKSKKWFRNLPLSRKVIMTMSGLFLSLTAGLSIYLFNDSSEVLQDQAHLILQNTAEKNQLNFNYSIKETEDIAFQLISDDDFLEFVQRYATDQNINDNVSFDFQTNVLPKIRQLLGDARKVAAFEIFMEDHYFYTSYESFRTAADTQEDFADHEFQWLEHEDKTTLELPFNIFDANLRKKGYLRLTINDPLFFQSINENEQWQNGFFVFDDHQQLIYDPNDDSKIASKLAATEQGQIQQVDHFIAKGSQLSTGWQVVTYYSMDSFHLDIGEFLRRVAVAGLLVLIGALVFGRIFSQWMVRPILRLNDHIRQNSGSQLPTPIEIISHDEVGQLTQSYNRMVADIQVLFHQNKEEEQAKHDAQLSAYQAQIQPHFLYNTLAIISWSAKKGDLARVEEITKNLAKYYRLVLAKGKRIASLQEELDLVYYYLEIQKIRFSEQLSAEIVVDPEIDTQHLFVMHRVLQPLVENALEHGVFPKGEGMIKVTVCQDSEKIFVYVADNGVGAPPAVVQRINQMRSGDDQKRGFSLQSIFQALRSYYRHGINLRFDSAEGEGTVVSIIIEKALLKENRLPD